MAPPAFDYSNRNTIVQNGVIYYSPNCTQPIVLPSCPSSNPFCPPHLNASMFRQPVWWSHEWAWLSFIPLALSFVFTPFEPLCTMPHIKEVAFSFHGPSGEIQSKICFRMNKYDIQCWVKEEECIIQVAHVIQLCYSISASMPLKPSSFHFYCTHKSHQMAKCMICLAQEWFAIWMGFISYLIAKSMSLVPHSP